MHAFFQVQNQLVQDINGGYIDTYYVESKFKKITCGRKCSEDDYCFLFCLKGNLLIII